MSAIASGSRPATPNADANLYIRIEEIFFANDLWPGGNQPPAQRYTGPDVVDSANRPFMLNNNGLAGPAFTGVAANGRRLVQHVSQAGFQFRRGGGASFPLSQEFQTVGALVQRVMKVYYWEIDAIAIVQGGAATWAMCLEDSDGGFRAVGTRPGVGWVCDPAINAGRFTPMSRVINGAAMTVGPDSGVSPLGAWRRLALRYVEGAQQRLEFLIDGVIRHTLVGDANVALVNPGGATQYPHWTPSLNTSAGVGTTFQYGPSLYEVRYQ